MTQAGFHTEQAPTPEARVTPSAAVERAQGLRSRRVAAALRAGAMAAAILGVTALVQVCRADALWEAQAWADAFLPLQGAQTPMREVIEALPFL